MVSTSLNTSSLGGKPCPQYECCQIPMCAPAGASCLQSMHAAAMLLGLGVLPSLCGVPGAPCFQVKALEMIRDLAAGCFHGVKAEGVCCELQALRLVA